jgi:Ca2+-binding EF-hand superfamily protein
VSARIQAAYKAVAANDVGIISTEEFHEILAGIGIGLSREERGLLIQQADLSGCGVITFREYEASVRELVRGLLLKEFAKEVLAEREEEYLLEAKLILQNDPVHDIREELATALQALDTEETGVLKISDIRKALEQFPGHLDVAELSELMKELSRKYGYNEVPVRVMHDELVLIKTEVLKQALFASSQTTLETHLVEALKAKDPDGTGKLKLEDAMAVFQGDDPRLQLSQMQKFVVRSAFEGNELGKVEYPKFTKLIAETIKSFFSDY